jgi:hypothetical protein
MRTNPGIVANFNFLLDNRKSTDRNVFANARSLRY